MTDDIRNLYITPPPCYNEERYPVVPYTPDNGYTDQQLFNLYGFQVGLLVYYSWETYYKWQTAETNSNTHYGWYSTEFDRNKKMKALEKRLRKACGSKCKKIATVASLSTRESVKQPTEANPSDTTTYVEHLSRFYRR